MRKQYLTGLVIFVLFPFSPIIPFAESNDSILVVGGTGRIGSEIVKALEQRGKNVRVFARTTSDRKRLQGLDISYVIGNVLTENDVAQALEQQKYDAVISSLAKVRQEPNPHAVGGQHLTKWAKKNGVKHFILISSLGAGPNPVHTKYKEILQAKGVAEAALTSSGIDYTIIRTGIILYGEEPATGKAQLILDQNVLGTITRKDLAQLTAECVLNNQCINQIYNAVDCSLRCQAQ
mgnify:CR=1 FL=1